MKLHEHREQWAEAEVARCLATLPKELVEVAKGVPVVFARTPSVEDDHDPDLLGLFVGYSVDEGGGTSDPMITRIELYLDNIWDYAEHSPADFIEEVRITYLHELGHCLGWDEEDLEERGLG